MKIPNEMGSNLMAALFGQIIGTKMQCSDHERNQAFDNGNWRSLVNLGK